MDVFDVAAIQRTAALLCTLRLVATPSNVGVVRNEAYAAASRYLRRLRHESAAPPPDLITWRPAHCVDVCLVPDAAGALVYVLQHGGPRGALETVPYAANDPLPQYAEDVFFCAHVTVDRTPDGDGAMVVLVYDSFRAAAGAGTEPCAVRYARVQQAVHAWRGCGHTHVLAQWAGDPSTREELERLPLPHARACVVALTDAGGYFRLPSTT